MMPEIYIADKQTLDNVHSKVDAANTNINAIKSKTDANLDATISSRASQATVNAINTNVGSDSDAASASGSLHAKMKYLQNRIGAGSGIKSVQRGVVKLTPIDEYGSIDHNITIASVNINKSFIVLPSVYNDGQTNHNLKIHLTFVNSTTIKIKGRAGGYVSYDLAWEVVEFY